MKIYYIIILVNIMKKMNNKGFTLVELIAIVVLLALVMGIGAISVTKIINNAKEKDYQLLVENIKSAVELYYQECKYSNDMIIDCPEANNFMGNDSYTIALNDLVKYGYLKTNGTNSDGDGILVNPIDNKYIGDCQFQFMYVDGKFAYGTNYESGSSCPELREE